MSFFSRTKTQTKIVVDIGSGGVSAGIVVFGEARPRILYTTQELFGTYDLESARGYFGAMKLKTQTVLKRVYSDGRTCAQHAGVTLEHAEAVITMTSPWIASTIKTVTKDFTLPTKITRALIDELTSDLAQEFIASELASPDAHDPLHELEVVSSQTVYTSVNGYTTTHPLDMTGTRFELHQYFSILPKLIRQDVTALFDPYHVSHISFYSRGEATQAVLKLFLPPQDSYILFDIGGGTLDVYLVLRGVLHEVIMLKTGTHALVDKVSRGLKIEASLASEEVRRYMNQPNTATQQTDIHSQVIEAALADTKAEIRRGLDELAARTILPYKTYVFAHTLFQSAFEKIIYAEKCERFKESLALCPVESIHNFDIDTLLDRSLVKDFSDPHFLIEVAFLNIREASTGAIVHQGVTSGTLVS